MRNLDRFKGCLMGGAIGDALGYAVEFQREPEIFKAYGPAGITRYDLREGLARISDDTQMTLFTATGLLYGQARGVLHTPNDDTVTCMDTDWVDVLHVTDDDAMICAISHDLILDLFPSSNGFL